MLPSAANTFYQYAIQLNPFKHLYMYIHYLWERRLSYGIHFNKPRASVADERSGLSRTILAFLFCKTCNVAIRVLLFLSPHIISAYQKQVMCINLKEYGNIFLILLIHKNLWGNCRIGCCIFHSMLNFWNIEGQMTLVVRQLVL